MLFAAVDAPVLPAAPRPGLESRERILEGLESILDRLPARNEGRFGRPGDPVNLLFVGSRKAVESGLARAGWLQLDPNPARALVEGLRDLLSGRGFDRLPPMNRYRLFGRLQDLNFAIPVNSPHSRHHFRLWRLPFTDPEGRELWWGSANFDLTIRWWDLSHRPDPDTVLERDFIAGTLRAVGIPASLAYLPHVPHRGKNDKGYAFVTDGRVLVAHFGDP